MLRHRNGTAIRCGLGDYPVPLDLKSKLKHGPLLTIVNSPQVNSPQSSSYGCLLRHSSAAHRLSKLQAKNSQIQASAQSLPTSRLTSEQPCMSSLTRPRVSSISQHSGFFTGGEDLRQVSPDTRRSKVWMVLKTRLGWALFLFCFSLSPESHFPTTERMFWDWIQPQETQMF